MRMRRPTRKTRGGRTPGALPLITFERCALETRRYSAASSSVMIGSAGVIVGMASSVWLRGSSLSGGHQQAVHGGAAVAGGDGRHAHHGLAARARGFGQLGLAGV